MAETSNNRPEDARALYRLPPEEFTAARDALARRLRSAGERAQAEEVRRLRRPNAPAWALDQIAQDRPELIDEVLATGSELREAMEIGDGRRLREAEHSTREASDTAVREAEHGLAAAGQSVSDDVRARLAATLRAAILDPDVASLLQSGMLERDVELPGFGLDMPMTPAPHPVAPEAPRRKPTHDDRKRQEREEREDQQKREERRAREEARRAAKRRLAELESEARRLGRQAERLAAAAEKAEEEARRARAEAEAAAAAADEAAARVAAVRRELEELAAE